MPDLRMYEKQGIIQEAAGQRQAVHFAAIIIVRNEFDVLHEHVQAKQVFSAWPHGFGLDSVGMTNTTGSVPSKPTRKRLEHHWATLQMNNHEDEAGHHSADALQGSNSCINTSGDR